MSEPTPEEYLRLKAEKKSDEDIAHIWGFATRDSVINRVKKWRAAGLLPPKEKNRE